MADNVRDILLRLAGQSESAQDAIRRVRMEVAALPEKKTVKFEGKFEDLQAELSAFRGEMEAIDKTTVEPKIRVRLEKAIAEVAEFEAILAAIPDEKKVTVKFREGLLSDLRRVEHSILGLGPSVAKTAREVDKLAPAVQKSTRGLRAIGPVLMGVGILMIATLLPAIVAVVSSLAALVTGIGLAATALVGALGPAVALAVALFQRLAAVMKVRQLAQQLNTQATKEGAEADVNAADAAEKRREAERALAAAVRNRQDAQRAFDDAKKAAQDAIDAALQKEREDTRALGDAQDDLAQATIDAHQAQRDAVLATRDAVLDLRDAELSRQDAKLGTEQALLDLRQLRQELGLTGREFDDAFKRMQDVSFDRRGLGSLFQSQGKDVGKENLLKLEEALLRVKRARLNEQQAASRQVHAQRDLAKARQTEADFAKEGIRAYQPYRDALDRVEDAQRTLNESTKHANELSQQGIDKNRQVIAAHEALIESIAALHHAQFEHDHPNNLDTLATSAAALQAEYKKLNPEERRFYDTLVDTGKMMRGFFKPATEAIFGALADGLRDAGGAVKDFKSDFKGMGQSVGGGIRGLLSGLAQPGILDNLHFFTQQAGLLFAIVAGQALPQFVRLVLDLGREALPMVRDGLESVTDWLGRSADAVESPGGLKSLGQIIQRVRGSFSAFFDMLGGFGTLLKGMILAFAPWGDKIMRFFGGAARALGKYLSSAKGQKEVNRFFKDAMPVFKSILGFLGRLIIFSVRAFHVMAPFIRGFFDGLNMILDVLNWVLGILSKITNNPIISWVLRLIGSFVAFGVVGKAVGLVGRIVGRFRRTFVGMVGDSVKAGRGLLRWFGGLPERVGGAVRATIRFLRRFPRRFYDTGRNMLRGLVDGVTSIGRWVYTKIKGLVDKIVGKVKEFLGIKSPSRVFSGIGKQMLAGLLDGFTKGDVSSFIKKRLGGIVGLAKEFIKHPDAALRFGFKLAKGAAGKAIGIAGDVAGGIRHRIGLAAGGLVRGPVEALIGEGAHHEAVLPLSEEVLRNLGNAIARAMSVGLPAPINAKGVGGVRAAAPGSYSHEQHFHIPPGPAGSVPDAKYVAAQLAQAMRKRGAISMPVMP